MNYQVFIRRGIVCITLFLLCYPETSGNNYSVLKWQKDGVTIELKEHLDVPGMSWPKTLLEYPVDFSAEPIDPSDMILVDLTRDESIPFQLTRKETINGKVSSAVLCFFSDLPSGGKREFRLANKKSFPKIKSQKPESTVHKTVQGNYIQLNNGSLRLEIPNAGRRQTFTPPIRQIGNTEKWLGKMAMPATLPMKRMEVIEVETGPLLAEYLFDCQFDEGRRFRLTLRLVAGMDYVAMEEDISGFSEQDAFFWNMVWSEFTPQYRYCPNRTGQKADKTQKGYNSFDWEPIEERPGDPNGIKHPDMPYDQQHGPDGLLPFKITPYHNWMTWWRLHTAAFWNEKTGSTIAIFIKDFEKWIDPAYPVWGSKDNTAIHFLNNKDGFRWRYPMTTCKRSTAIAIYPHQKDIELVDRHSKASLYVDYLRKWYGWVSLDKTKNWILDYGERKSEHPVFFKENNTIKPQDVLRSLKNEVQTVADGGERTDGPNPVRTRTFYSLTELFEQTEKRMTLEEYKQARALYLFMTYVFMDEALMPMQTMLSGHPNFLADVKGVPALAVFLFPDHPHAQQMVDHFEKSVALNLRYHTRPDEPAWDAHGGRWTENLACYTWAFLRPTLKPTFLLHHCYDGKNRMLQPNISLYGDWLLNGLTTPLNIENGKRGLPPQGAHVRRNVPPNLLYLLGVELKYYDPLLSEHLLWVATPENPHFESSGHWEEPMLARFTYTGGTNPHLKSSKYTGYGITMRSDFNKPDEMYVHLQQIDAGPNYRWGRAAKGGNGVIYYNAQGKRYSHNGEEDVGDAPFGDTDRCTNFGVKKGGCYRCIGDWRSVGTNELTEPLYDFGFAQFASVLANEEAAPEYQSRSVLMSGSDYILIFDHVKDNTVEGRLSWFVDKDEDFPYIHQLIPGIAGVDANIQPSNTPYHRDPPTLPTKGRYYDGKGNFLTLVTHKESIKPVAVAAGTYQTLKPDGSTEWVFRSDQNISFDREQKLFEGRAGLIRQSKDGKTFEAALFQGKKTGLPGIAAEWVTVPKHGGMSMKKDASGFSGIFQALETTSVRLILNKKLPKGMVFYLDGQKTELTASGNNVYTLTLPAGKHHWQWTDKGVVPQAPTITKSILGASHCTIGWTFVAGATSYLVEKSMDGGNTWANVAENIRENRYRLSGLTAGTKIHVRVTAQGEGGLSEPSNDYPVYSSNDKPYAPQGLLAVCSGNQVQLSWGQILGVDQYALYQRKKGTTNFQKVYSGDQRATSLHIPDGDIYEFAVTAINDNGESEKSFIADTDPNRLINWYPVPGEVFRRDTESHENGYHEYNHWIEQEMPVLKYPFQME